MRTKLKGKAISSERFFTRTMMKYGPIASNLREFTRCSGSNVDGRTEFMKKREIIEFTERMCDAGGPFILQTESFK